MSKLTVYRVNFADKGAGQTYYTGYVVARSETHARLRARRSDRLNVFDTSGGSCEETDVPADAMAIAETLNVLAKPNECLIGERTWAIRDREAECGVKIVAETEM